MGKLSASSVSRQRNGFRFAVVGTVGWSLILALAVEPALAKKKPVPEVDDVEDLQIVDCLLPGKIRRLGRRSQYVAPRRPIRTTAVDCEIRGGDYVAHDPSSYASALEFWLPSAKAGDAKAQTYVGEIFEKGLAGSPDFEIAAVWYRRAAEQGFARGQINLAHFYEQGLGVPLDREQALEWYRKAAGITEEVVLDSRAEAEALRAELDDATKEAEQLEAQLAEAERSLEGVRSDLEGTREEVEGLRRQLEEAKADASRAQGEAVERLAAEIERRESKIAERTEELARRGDEVADRRQAFEDFRQRVEAVRAAARKSGGSGPSIEIVRPDVLTSRGPALVPVPAGVSQLTVTGRVDAPAGLSGLTVDDRPLEVDSKGLFETTVAYEVARKEIHFEARDASGRTARATLVLEPAISGSAPSEAPASASSGKRRTTASTLGASPGADAADGPIALIIGVTNYSHFPSLRTAGTDAQELAEVLAEKYGFRTKILTDPSTLAILLELKALAESLGADDELLIYYAGHGKIDRETERGFWIPADAETDNAGKWIANAVITDYLDLIPASRILVVSDSCYSGTMTRSGLTRRPGESHPGRSRLIAGKRSRTVLTSGGLQPVLDEGGGEHSIFARALLTVLKLNDEPLSGALLHREVAARVTYAASELGVEQVPYYAPIQFSGHETGDFVLTPTRTRSSSRSQASP